MTKKLNPNCVDTYYTRGLARSRNGECDLAIEDYTKAIELDPEFVDAYYNRGVGLQQKR